MTKRITRTNVIPLRSRNDERAGSPSDRAILAERKAREAWDATGAKRARLAQDALAISEDCAEAYMALATYTKDWQVRIKLHRQAVAAAERVLGPDWEQKYKGIFWMAHETRPLMRALAGLANALRWEDELEEATNLYRKLMHMNPSDNLGIRYELAPCLFEAGQYKELEKLLAEHEGEVNASLFYTEALYLFLKQGGSAQANEALRKAFKQNPHVPLYLPGIVEVPDEKPFAYGVGDENEAITFAWDNSYLWFDTPGASEWMAEVLGDDLRQMFNVEDKELVEDVLKELKLEMDDSPA